MKLILLLPFLDMGWAPLTIFGGLSVLAIAAPITILIEAYLIFRLIQPLGEYSFKQSILFSVIMNIASGVLGYLVMAIFFGPSVMVGDFLGADYYSSTPLAVGALIFGMMIGFCWVSILVEGVLLSLMAPRSPKSSVWLVVILGNLVSYLGLFILLIILILK